VQEGGGQRREGEQKRTKRKKGGRGEETSTIGKDPRRDRGKGEQRGQRKGRKKNTTAETKEKRSRVTDFITTEKSPEGCTTVHCKQILPWGQ
jgi:hypothetical protein